MAYTTPVVADFKAYFVRDFSYGTDPTKNILDADIAKALVQASVNFNSSLWATQEIFSMAYMYLTAHYLVVDIRASTQGIAGSFSWLTTNKAVGNVSEGFSIPQRILDNPFMAMLSKTPYGAKYLELALPQLLGPFSTTWDPTHP